jgi:hypothetical protein
MTDTEERDEAVAEALVAGPVGAGGQEAVRAQ